VRRDDPLSVQCPNSNPNHVSAVCPMWSAAVHRQTNVSVAGRQQGRPAETGR